MCEIRFLFLNWSTVISRNFLCKGVLQTITVAVNVIEYELIRYAGNE